MTDPERTEELAVLLQETVEELKQQRELNQQLKSLIETNSQQLEAAHTQSASALAQGSRSRPNTSTRTVVSLQTRNLVHSVYKEVTNTGNTGWNFSQRFESADNQQILITISQELNSLSPETSKEEISSACKTYFRSLKDDFRRKSKGVLEAHRKDLKVKKRLKQKLKQRQTVLSEAARSLKWTSLNLSHVNQILSEDYMTSADESDTAENSYKVREIPWLRKRYKRAFHALDKFYVENKISNRSKKMTRSRVRSRYTSERSIPPTVPSWAVADAYRDDTDESPSPLDTSNSSVVSDTN